MLDADNDNEIERIPRDTRHARYAGSVFLSTKIQIEMIHRNIMILESSCSTSG